MNYMRIGDGFLVRLAVGEEIMGGLRTLMEKEDLGTGALTGLGAVRDVELGCFDVERKGYRKRSFEGVYELIGVTGTLSWYEDEPWPHVHLLLAGEDFNAVGGHCFEATTAVTVEMHVRAVNERVNRKMDEAIGLHLMQFPESCPIGP